MDDKIKKPYTILWVEDEENEGLENKLKEEYEIIKVKNITEFKNEMQFQHKFDFAILDANIPRKENEEEKTVLVQLIHECEANNLGFFILSAKISFDSDIYDQFSYLENKIYKKKRKEIERLLFDLKKHFNNNIISKYPNFYNSCKRGFFSNLKLWDKIEPFLKKYYSRGVNMNEFEIDINKNLNFNFLRSSIEELVDYYQKSKFIPESINKSFLLMLYMDGRPVIVGDKINKQGVKYNRVRCKKRDILTYKNENKIISNKKNVFMFIIDILNALSHKKDDLHSPVISKKSTIFLMYLDFMEFMIHFIETTFISQKQDYIPWEEYWEEEKK
tara:strand:- start:1035 stop:2027 length:993 start_codon:yes stop_codon:yes gene_type:complete